MGKYDLLRVNQLAQSGEMMVLHFQVKTFYCEQELEKLLEVLERRGANYNHQESGRYRVTVSPDIPCVPFYQTIQDCPSVELTDVTTVSQRRTILIDQEG